MSCIKNSERGDKKMPIEVVDIKPENGLLSMLLADFYICPYCDIVDRAPARASADYKCSSCGELPNPAGLFYFHIQDKYYLCPMELFRLLQIV